MLDYKINLLELLKILFINNIAILAFSYYHYGLVDSVIITFGLISIIYIIDSRINGIITAASFLISFLLLIVGKDILANKFVVRGFYFLIITLFTLFRENWVKEQKLELKYPILTYSKKATDILIIEPLNEFWKKYEKKLKWKK